nr:MAG TPA_asm: hypothetical protein [Caudoviricetes sp.]
MTCNDRNTLLVETVTIADTNIALTTTNSNDRSSLDNFVFKTGCKTVANVVTGSPLPVQIIINGTAVSLLNRYSLPVLSNRVPRRSRGAYVVPTSGTPYVILFDTPYCKCNA